MPQSEVARLRARIAEECQAMYTLARFSSTASHRSIDARYHSLERYHAQLSPLVGERSATEMIVDIFNQNLK